MEDIYMTHTRKYLIFFTLIISLLLAGCVPQGGDYVPASSISQNGFARNGQATPIVSGQEIKLWGYVDHGNLYGDEGVRKILEEWWSGEGPTATTWRFNLKANADDEIGRSFAVHVPNDAGRDALLKQFLADAQAQKPTRVFVKGKLFTFDAPTNEATLTGLTMELQSSDDISFEPPGQTGVTSMKTSEPTKPATVTALEAAYGAPSQSGFGSAVFHEAMNASDDLTEAALATYKYFTGELWERFGEDAWMGPWKEVYARRANAKADIVAELRGIADADAQISVPMILDNIDDAEQARTALAAVYDDPSVTELRVFNLGDGGAMSGILVAGRRAQAGEAVFLVFLLD